MDARASERANSINPQLRPEPGHPGAARDPGQPKVQRSQDLPNFDDAAFANSIGLRGIRVETPEQVGLAWHEALTSDRPVVIDALCDPDVPPLPAHITLAQAKAFTFAVGKGDPDALGIAVQAIRQKVDEILPHRS
jgi:pyruvate dehydrogenase (quinone)